MKKQKTISKSVSLEGIGLHTGNLSRVSFMPAKQDTGIKFIRVDLKEKPVIAANYKLVSGLVRGTTLSAQNAKVHTIEHILAVCSSFEIDNLEIQITNNEPPILDGSALPFALALIDAGITEQDTERRYFKLKKPVFYESGKTKITAYPSEDFEIDCTIGYDHPFLRHQHAFFKVTPEIFIKEIAPARTFCFDYEIESLKSNGLAKGGNLDNAIVIGLTGIHNVDKNLRFHNEFARHKMLDLIGDLNLLGLPIKAKIVAERCGHNQNINFVKELAKIIESGVSVK